MKLRVEARGVVPSAGVSSYAFGTYWTLTTA